MKRLVFLLHRWSAIVLGVFVLAWFVSGIALAYYPWPLVTPSGQLRMLEPFRITEADTVIIGFREAAAKVRTAGGGEVVGGRLEMRAHQLVYELWREESGIIEPATLLDAHTGAFLTPLDHAHATALAAGALRDGAEHASATDADLLATGDVYMLSHEYQKFFPAWRVRFNDPAATWVYVSRDRGTVFGIVTARTRWITWLGVVPHWLYFPWLYHHPALWTWLNILLPAFAVIIAITGIVWGASQLLPLRVNGQWRMGPYRGTSLWHHVAGIVFGLFVLTWTVSGVLEMFGSDHDVRPGQAARVRSGGIVWKSLLLREPLAMFQAAPALGGPPGKMSTVTPPLAYVELAQVLGQPGYDVRLADGHEVWLDAVTGLNRAELDPEDAGVVALSAMPLGTRVWLVDRLAHPDYYYYARPGREVHFPVYRVVFDDVQHSRLYLDAMTGVPTGFVDGSTRAWRWWRDAMHSWDYPGLNGRRPLWDIIVMLLLLGGTLSSATGLWMGVRRVVRIARR